MNIAVVIDCICGDTNKLLDTVAKKHTVCIFLPEGTKPPKTEQQVRFFEDNFDVTAFQRYDAAVFMAVKHWMTLLPLIEQIKCAVVISKDNEYYQKIASYTEYTVSEILEVNQLLDSMPEHVMWFARSEKEIFSRARAFGLLTDKFKEAYYNLYSLKSEKGN